MQLPNEKLIDIAGELDMKMKYFVHKQTGELVPFPDDLLWDVFDGDADTWQPLIDRVNNHRKDFIAIERMPSYQYFKVMEEFAGVVKENWVRNKIIDALNGKKPFAHFNAFIHQTNEHHKKAWLPFDRRRWQNG